MDWFRILSRLFVNIAGSFPHTLPQCLRQLSISGSRRSCRLSRMEDKTRLFQLKLGDGQHAFCAHGSPIYIYISFIYFFWACADGCWLTRRTRRRLSHQCWRLPQSDARDHGNERVAGGTQRRFFSRRMYLPKST